MNNFAKKSALLALVAGLGLSGVSVAQAQERVYWTAPAVNNVVVRDTYNLCWRTPYWTPALAAKDPAGCECDKDLLPKEVCAPPAPKVETPKGPVSLPGVVGDRIKLNADFLFDFDKAVLRPEGKKVLDDLAAKMMKPVQLEVALIVGHTDRIGSDDYNQKLSEKRAVAVKDYLISKGLEANRLYTEGKGEKWPTKDTEKCTKMGAENGHNKKLVACLQPDRRVEIEIVGVKPTK